MGRDSRTADLWANGKTTVAIDGDEIVVDELPESELKRMVGHEVPIMKTEPGYCWFAEDDQND
jgi:hypothetical protein